MKSRITIEVDYENNNNPVIQILSKHSDDVRDNLIKAFYQKLNGSSWCKVVFRQDEQDPEQPERNFKRIFISPISEDELKKEAEIMFKQHKLNEEFLEKIRKN